MQQKSKEKGGVWRNARRGMQDEGEGLAEGCKEGRRRSMGGEG